MEFDDVNYHDDHDLDLCPDEDDIRLSQIEMDHECPRCTSGCNYCLMTSY